MWSVRTEVLPEAHHESPHQENAQLDRKLYCGAVAAAGARQRELGLGRIGIFGYPVSGRIVGILKTGYPVSGQISGLKSGYLASDQT